MTKILTEGFQIDPQEVNKFCLESEAKLLQFCRAEIKSIIQQQLLEKLKQKFNQDFKFLNNRTEKNWGAMNEASISALFQPSKKKGIDYIEKF